MAKQDEQVVAIRTEQRADFAGFTDRLEALVARQDEQAIATRAELSTSLARFTDRLEALVAGQNEQATAIRAELHSDFARIVDRQDSHFRWLVGLLVASVVALASLLYKSIHP